MFGQVWSYRSGQASRPGVARSPAHQNTLPCGLTSTALSGKHGCHGCLTKRPHHAPLCESIGDLPSPSAVTKSPKQIACRIGAPFALHHLSVPAARIWRPFGRASNILVQLQTKVGLRVDTHTGRTSKHANTATRAGFNSHRDQTGGRLTKCWRVAQTLIEIWSGVATARDRRCCERMSPQITDHHACIRTSTAATKTYAGCSPAGGAAEHWLGLSGTVSSFPNIERFSMTSHRPPSQRLASR